MHTYKAMLKAVGKKRLWSAGRAKKKEILSLLSGSLQPRGVSECKSRRVI